jgi:hypothetical protein
MLTGTSIWCLQGKHCRFEDLSSFIHSFIQWLYGPLLGPGLFFNCIISFIQTVELHGRVISPSQGRYLHKHKINALTNIHATRGIGTHDPSLRASEDSSWFRPRGRRDRSPWHLTSNHFKTDVILRHEGQHFALVIHSTDSETGRDLLPATMCEEDLSPERIKSQSAMDMNMPHKSLSLQRIS